MNKPGIKSKPKKQLTKRELKEQKEKAAAEAKRAAEEELERQKAAAAAAIAAEEARLLAIKQAEEEERQKKALYKATQPATYSEEQKEVCAWLQSIPFSQRLGRIERDFSDGTLVAELIQYYNPKLCNKKNYFKWNSTINKRSNWTLLNYKVFSKMGFQLRDKEMDNIMKPYACGRVEKQCENLYIYKLLLKIRDKLGEKNPAVFAYKQKNNVPPVFPIPEKKKPRRYRCLKCTLSKVDKMIEEGYYDKKDKKEGEEEEEENKPACVATCLDMAKFIEREKKWKEARDIRKRGAKSLIDMPREHLTDTNSETATIRLRPEKLYTLQPDCEEDQEQVKCPIALTPCYSCFYI